MILGKKLVGYRATAQEVHVEDKDMLKPEHRATVAVWFINAPGQSIAWDDYLLAVYHLRPIEGLDVPIVKQYEAITHELVLLALNPEGNPEPLKMETWGALHPHNLVMQLELPHDEAASDLLERSARAVTEGLLWAEPPLSGMVEPWRTSLLMTSAHYRNEPHAGHNL